MGLKQYLVRRSIGIFATFITVATLIFFLFRQVSSPVGLYVGGQLSDEQLEAIRASFGLDQPLYIQYLEYMYNIFMFEFGVSFFYQVPTHEVVFERLLNTFFLTIPALLFAYFIGVVGGVYIGWNRGKSQEKIGLVTAIFFRSTPRFWLGLVLLFIFGATFTLFPLSGMLPSGTEFTRHRELLFMPSFYHHLVLPILSLGLYLAGLPLLLMRTSIFDVMNKDYVTIARAKGATERTIMYRHVARNALLPVTTAFGVAVGFSFGGAVLVETVFSYPGVGRLMVDSVFRGDYPVAQFAFLMMALAIMIMNLIVDIAYGYLDPRVTYD
jgi:peptide/nickel transport system permease protein